MKTIISLWRGFIYSFQHLQISKLDCMRSSFKKILYFKWTPCIFHHNLTNGAIQCPNQLLTVIIDNLSVKNFNLVLIFDINLPVDFFISGLSQKAIFNEAVLWYFLYPYFYGYWQENNNKIIHKAFSNQLLVAHIKGMYFMQNGDLPHNSIGTINYLIIVLAKTE